MTNAPPLREDEEVIHDHTPALGAFKRTALGLLALTVPVVVVFAVVFPDSYWPAVPLFVTCLLLMQERATLGRHRAWLTNRRIILQGGQSVELSDVRAAAPRRVWVSVSYGGAGKTVKLHYPEDGAALAQAIEAARQAAP